jgi:uncharacterized membrane protein
MNRKHYIQIRAAVTVFVSAIVSLSVVRDSYLLSAAGVITGMIFMVLVRWKAKIRTDEREKTVQEKAARMTYSIFASTLGIGAFLLLLPSRGGIAVFAKGDFLYLESLGTVLAYLALFLIALYAISFHFYNRKYGGGKDEE